MSLPINSLVDSPDHPLAFPPTEHGAHSAFLDINAPHDRGDTIGFLCGKLVAQFLIDRVVAALFDARSIGWSVCGRAKRLLDTLSEEVDGVVDHVVGQHVEGGEHLRRLLALDHLLPQRRTGLQLRLCSLQPVALDELLGHAAEHQTGRHAHRRGAGAEALARLGLVVVLQRLDADSLQPLAASLLQLRQFHVATHQG